MPLVEKRSIILIGMPGAGKSTAGRLLSERLSMPFMDTDAAIEEKYGRRLQDIIDHEGLPVFNHKEETVISQLRFNGHIVSTGGSVVYSETGMANLRSQGLVIWLMAPLEELSDRMRESVNSRGIAVEAGQTIEELFDLRQPLYEKYADLCVQTSGRTPEAVVEEIIRRTGSV